MQAIGVKLAEQSRPAMVTPRYQLGRQLGAGAMGAVYQAEDRLTGQKVALKRVTVAPEALAFASRPAEADTQELLLALTHEFRTLAMLRHPHIISVLDYGFDSGRQPFFTMELLHGAQTLLAAGRDLAIRERVGLLLQATEALAYLHRRGILHHDLKPENILVINGQVRLLDFGLAVVASQTRSNDTFGTLLYLAPEVLNGQPYTVASDLYSLGVIAYELLAGAHPFPATSVSDYLDQIFDKAPELTRLAGSPVLATLIGELLAKTAEVRPASAQAVITRLQQAIGQLPQPTTTAIRESYLQAATFIGRDAELSRLTTALAAACAGQGNSWLVGGESGVGKSRLLDELRAEALVAGAQVVRGQAVERGGLPYQLWRNVLPSLVLTITLTDLEAGVLLEIVPELPRLLERPLTPAPALAGEAGRQRLSQTILTVLERQTQPVVLLLEDLQWASESLAPLQQLIQRTNRLPLLIVATYRNDEHLTLPELLPEMTNLPLRRLNEQEIGALSQSMLGEAGAQASVVTLLQRETEGNVFFLVEVVRALAEEAGSLLKIGQMTLPTQIFAGGIEQIVHRRLDQMPGWGQRLLWLAAVAGRQLDNRVLMQLSQHNPQLLAEHGLEAWLAAGANAAVLTVENGNWQFAHDKLRAHLLRVYEEPVLHQQVAEALEAAYPQDVQYAEALATHWQAAGDAGRALPYVLTAVEHMVQITNENDRALAWIERSLPHATLLQQAKLLGLRGIAFYNQNNFAQALAEDEASLAAAGDDASLQVQALNRIGAVHDRMGRLPEARVYQQQALDLARSVGDQNGIAKSLFHLGNLAKSSGEYALSRTYYEEALLLYRTLGNLRAIANTLSGLSNVAEDVGEYAKAETYLSEQLQICRALGYRRGVAGGTLNLGCLKNTIGEHAAALPYFADSIALFRQLDELGGVGIAQLNGGMAYLRLGDYAAACQELLASQAVFDRLGMVDALGVTCIQLGQVAARQGEYQAACAYFEQALTLLRDIGAIRYVAEALAFKIFPLVFLGEVTAARIALTEVISLTLQLENPPRLLQMVLFTAAYVAFALGAAEQSARCFGATSNCADNAGDAQYWDQQLYHQLRARLDDARLAALLEEGRQQEPMTLLHEAQALCT